MIQQCNKQNEVFHYAKKITIKGNFSMLHNLYLVSGSTLTHLHQHVKAVGQVQLVGQ